MQKIFFQLLWKIQLTKVSNGVSENYALSWDDRLPNVLVRQWLSIFADMKKAEAVKVPRFLGRLIQNRVEIHGFGDASEKAFAAAIYVRILQNNQSFVSLIAAKTKVRLEPD